MSYINTFKLIKCLVEGSKPDSNKLLSEINMSAINQALTKSKDGIPRSFVCINEPMEESNLSKMKHQDKEKLWEVYDRLKLFKERSEQELPILMALHKKYPKVPAIYNYITIAYANMKAEEKCHQSIIDTCAKFPNYLFGKISLAEYLLNKNRHKEIPEAFNKKFEIYMHYPRGTQEFHVSEVVAFYSVIGIYYARTRKTSRAIFYYYIAKKADPDHWYVQKLADEIIVAEIQKIKKKMNNIS